MSALPTATVVVCVYTEKRWFDIKAAVDSVLDQDVTPLETIVVVDHNERLRERAEREFGPLGVVVGGAPVVLLGLCAC